MNSAQNQLFDAISRMSSTEKELLNRIIPLVQREKHLKKLKSARNKRYYQRHKDKILAKQKMKTAIYNKIVQGS